MLVRRGLINSDKPYIIGTWLRQLSVPKRLLPIVLRGIESSFTDDVYTIVCDDSAYHIILAWKNSDTSYLPNQLKRNSAVREQIEALFAKETTNATSNSR